MVEEVHAHLEKYIDTAKDVVFEVHDTTDAYNRAVARSVQATVQNASNLN